VRGKAGQSLRTEELDRLDASDTVLNRQQVIEQEHQVEPLARRIAQPAVIQVIKSRISSCMYVIFHDTNYVKFAKNFCSLVV
jgi:hypothetical protein